MRDRVQVSGFRFGEQRATWRQPLSVWSLLLSSCFLILSLTGCFLISGPTESSDQTPDGGNVYVSFVSAEGTRTTAVQTNFPDQELEVYVLARNEKGQMRVELLNADGALAFAVEGQAQETGNRNVVRTDAAGVFRYRIRATGAQRGAFQILYQPTGG